jgi:ABC-type glutathione transport system ATPase component
MSLATEARIPSAIPVGGPDRAPVLVVDDVFVQRFETREGPVTAVDHMSLDVRPGEFVSVIGPSGCGKSTLFNVIGGLIDPTDGQVRVASERVSGPHPAIGMVFQEESTFPWRSVVDNVAFPLEIRGVPKAERLERARHFISLVGLDGFETALPLRTVRRHAPARGDRPDPGLRAQDPADGRALRGAGRADPAAARRQGDRRSSTRCSRPSC